MHGLKVRRSPKEEDMNKYTQGMHSDLEREKSSILMFAAGLERCRTRHEEEKSFKKRCKTLYPHFENRSPFLDTPTHQIGVLLRA